MNDCANHADVLRRIEVLEANMSKQSEKVNIIEVQVGRYDERIESLFSVIKALDSKLSAVCEKLDIVIQRPAKKWEGMIDKAIAAIIGALISGLAGAIFFILTKIK